MQGSCLLDQISDQCSDNRCGSGEEILPIEGPAALIQGTVAFQLEDFAGWSRECEKLAP